MKEAAALAAANPKLVLISLNCDPEAKTATDFIKAQNMVRLQAALGDWSQSPCRGRSVGDVQHIACDRACRQVSAGSVLVVDRDSGTGPP